MVSKLSRKGQVTIPHAMRPAVLARPTREQGFGMVKVKGPHVPANWVPGQWLNP
ncbi:MAG: hypothetical protein RJB34_1307 [Pseudomonadota bacterium]|jgi:hypothetical protein